LNLPYAIIGHSSDCCPISSNIVGQNICYVLEKETLTTQYKTIKISRRYYDELSKLGEVKDSFDKVIGRLLETRKMQQEVIAAN